MKIWGYIFIVLNIAAAGAFVYFATQVWKARTEWQLALVKQKLAIDGLPLEPPPAPSNLQADSVPIRLDIGTTTLDQIRKSILEAAIPNGGSSKLASRELVTSQDKEVERIQPIVFSSFALEKVKIGEKDFELLTPTKRQQLAITLLSLADTAMRRGIYALYRDLDVEGRYEWARHDLHFLGRTQPQQSALRVLAAIGRINEAINLSEPPEVVKNRVVLAKIEIARWLKSEIPHAAPKTYRSPYAAPPTADNPDPKNEDYELLESKLKPLIDTDADNNDPITFELPQVILQSLKDSKKEIKETEVLTHFPKGLLLKVAINKDEMAAKARADQLRMQIDAAVNELKEQLKAETGFKGEMAKLLVPFLADVAGNQLETVDQLNSARKRLQELLDLRASTPSEKKAYAALIEVYFAPKPFAQQKDDDRYHREKNIDDIGLELLRSYFEEALAKVAPVGDLPEDPAQARAKIGSIKPLRSVTQKRKDIAHLLYHLDGYLAIDWVKLTEKTVGGTKGQYYDGNIQARTRWFKLMFPAVAAVNPADETLGDEERKNAALDLDKLHRERADWHKRVAAIIGLKAYVETIEARATEISKLAATMIPILKKDQLAYEQARQDLIFSIIEFNRTLDQRYLTLDEEEAIRVKWKADFDAREAEAIALRKEHDKARADAKTSLTALEKKVDELYAVTKKLGEAQDALIGLELQLRNIEIEQRNKRSK